MATRRTGVRQNRLPVSTATKLGQMSRDISRPAVSHFLSAYTKRDIYLGLIAAPAFLVSSFAISSSEIIYIVVRFSIVSLVNRRNCDPFPVLSRISTCTGRGPRTPRFSMKFRFAWQLIVTIHTPLPPRRIATIVNSIL